MTGNHHLFRSTGTDNQENDQPEPITPKRKQHHYDGSFTQVESVVTDMEGLSLGATGVYTYLASYCYDGRNECWPSIPTICKRFGCNRKTINGYVDELERQGLIERTQRRAKGKALFESNSYCLIYRHRMKKPVGRKTTYGEP